MENSDKTLIHIGLPKSGSTALQHFWSKAPHIESCWNNLNPMVAEVRNALHQFKDYDELPEFAEFLPDVKKANCELQVYTSEALSTFSWGHGLSADDVTKARWFFADIMYKHVPKAIILLVVRNPVDWMLSVYKQYIQEGGTLALNDFIAKERAFLLATLNIKELCEIWAEYYSVENIVVMPAELLRTNVELCNKMVSDRMRLKQKCKVIDQLPIANASITDKEVNYMRDMACRLEHLEAHSERSTLTFKKLKKELLLALRSELQMGGKLSGFVNSQEVRGDSHIDLNADAVAFLKENMVDYIQQREGSFYDVLPAYYSGLDKATVS